MIPAPAIDSLQWLLGRGGPIFPIIARMVKHNMQAVGAYDRIIYRDYFRHVAVHLANGLRISRYRNHLESVANMAREEIDLDPSIQMIRRTIDDGQGAVIAPAHCSNFLISLARLNQEVPLCIYLRWSKNQAKLDMKQQWCRLTGLDVILEAPSATDPTTRAAVCIEALQEGRILVITPDIAQKTLEGVPAAWFGRQIHLPAGPAALAMLAEVPMIPLFARFDRRKQSLYCEDAIMVRPLSRSEGGRQEALRRAMQTWTDGFARFIGHSPQGWLLWGDSRWSRVLQNDSKYASPLSGACFDEINPLLVKEPV